MQNNSPSIPSRNFGKELCWVKFLTWIYFSAVAITAAAATLSSSDLNMNCYVCNSGPRSNPNPNCPPSGITAPYLIHNELCYGRCFIKTEIRNPNVIYRGCTDAYPELPNILPMDECHTYAEDIWCLCTSNMCNRGTMNDLRNPKQEEEEEEEGEEGGGGGRRVAGGELERGRDKRPNEKPQNPPPIFQQGRSTNNKYERNPPQNFPPDPPTNQMRQQWHLKRMPPEITDRKSPDGGAEAYLDVRATNASWNITLMKETQRELTNETLRDFGNGGATLNHFSYLYLNGLCVTLSFLHALIFT